MKYESFSLTQYEKTASAASEGGTDVAQEIFLYKLLLAGAKVGAVVVLIGAVIGLLQVLRAASKR